MKPLADLRRILKLICVWARKNNSIARAQNSSTDALSYSRRAKSAGLRPSLLARLCRYQLQLRLRCSRRFFWYCLCVPARHFALQPNAKECFKVDGRIRPFISIVGQNDRKSGNLPDRAQYNQKTFLFPFMVEQMDDKNSAFVWLIELFEWIFWSNRLNCFAT